MFSGIQDKWALITGASRGIGEAIARSLAEAGAKVVAVSRTAEDLDKLIQALGGKGRGHVAIAHDLSESQACEQLVEQLTRLDISPDIIVHNVGGNLGVTDPFCSIEDWRRVMKINVDVPIELNRIFVPAMQQKGWGRVCHISSISALENQGPPAYCAAKAALVAYTRSFGRYVSSQGVIVTSVLPGAIFTEGGYWDQTRRERPEHVDKYLSERMAIKRFGQPEEVSQLVAFLCSNHASFCVGSAFLVDGGQGRVFYAQE